MKGTYLSGSLAKTFHETNLNTKAALLRKGSSPWSGNVILGKSKPSEIQSSRYYIKNSEVLIEFRIP